MTTNSNYNNRRPRWGPHARWAAPFAALVILMALAAACSGGAASPGVADIESTPSTPANDSSSTGSTEPDVLAYSQCMRANGVPGFPDPNSEGGLTLDAGSLGLDPNSPQFQAADEACKRYLPPSSGGQRPDRETILKYSQCMRDHGISDFPDPNPEGGIEIQVQPGSDLDPNNPQFQAANEACKQFLPDGGEGADSGLNEVTE